MANADGGKARGAAAYAGNAGGPAVSRRPDRTASSLRQRGAFRSCSARQRLLGTRAASPRSGRCSGSRAAPRRGPPGRRHGPRRSSGLKLASATQRAPSRRITCIARTTSDMERSVLCCRWRLGRIGRACPAKGTRSPRHRLVGNPPRRKACRVSRRLWRGGGRGVVARCRGEHERVPEGIVVGQARREVDGDAKAVEQAAPGEQRQVRAAAAPGAGGRAPPVPSSRATGKRRWRARSKRPGAMSSSAALLAAPAQTAPSSPHPQAPPMASRATGV